MLARPADLPPVHPRSRRRRRPRRSSGAVGTLLTRVFLLQIFFYGDHQPGQRPAQRPAPVLRRGVEPDPAQPRDRRLPAVAARPSRRRVDAGRRAVGRPPALDARGRGDRRHRDHGARAAPGRAGGRRPLATDAAAAPPGRPAPAGAVGLDARLRGGQPADDPRRAQPGRSGVGRLLGLLRGVHDLRAAPRPPRRVDRHHVRARAGPVGDRPGPGRVQPPGVARHPARRPADAAGRGAGLRAAAPDRRRPPRARRVQRSRRRQRGRGPSPASPSASSGSRCTCSCCAGSTPTRTRGRRSSSTSARTCSTSCSPSLLVGRYDILGLAIALAVSYASAPAGPSRCCRTRCPGFPLRTVLAQPVAHDRRGGDRRRDHVARGDPLGTRRLVRRRCVVAPGGRRCRRRRRVRRRPDRPRGPRSWRRSRATARPVAVRRLRRKLPPHVQAGQEVVEVPHGEAHRLLQRARRPQGAARAGDRRGPGPAPPAARAGGQRHRQPEAERAAAQRQDDRAREAQRQRPPGADHGRRRHQGRRRGARRRSTARPPRRSPTS